MGRLVSHLLTTFSQQVALFVIVPLVVVSGMIVMAMIVASMGVSRGGLIVSGVSVVAVCRVIMLGFKAGFVQPVLPNVSGL